MLAKLGPVQWIIRRVAGLWDQNCPVQCGFKAMAMGRRGIIENVAVAFVEFLKANAQFILSGLGDFLRGVILLPFEVHLGITIDKGLRRTSIKL